LINNRGRWRLLVNHGWGLGTGDWDRSRLSWRRWEGIQKPDACCLFITRPSLGRTIGRYIMLRRRAREALQLAGRRGDMRCIDRLAIDDNRLGNPVLRRTDLGKPETVHTVANPATKKTARFFIGTSLTFPS